MSIRRFFLNENMSTKKAIKESTDSVEVFDNSLDEEYDLLVEGPFDIFKKKKLSPEQEAYATALRAGVDKVDFVQVNPKAGLEKEFFDVDHENQMIKHINRLMSKCRKGSSSHS